MVKQADVLPPAALVTALRICGKNAFATIS
jgi:hypothetical protein